MRVRKLATEACLRIPKIRPRLPNDFFDLRDGGTVRELSDPVRLIEEAAELVLARISNGGLSDCGEPPAFGDFAGRRRGSASVGAENWIESI